MTTTTTERSKKDELMRTINTILLSIITIVITVGATLIVDSTRRLNDKLDSLMIQVAINTANLKAHDVESQLWKDKITALETGQAEATMDRITKTEALNAIDDLRVWVDKFYERKH